ncbi:hypothetical protein K435DRAFT_968168 [Dendrothele bispora CBS 962.96]|uniref:Uncharacterized protein n=1 Tax=Dendrothele bispora (strain CBS 962.96) TaxID=1314807 RepID=A0A4S8LQM4_DENBC|nr:hypothetical protein K435DRAFT_968168 [Dendrothele bispora CBS 962.96]
MASQSKGNGGLHLIHRNIFAKYFTNDNFPKLIVALVTPTSLNVKKTIGLDGKDEPILTAGRDHPFPNNDRDVRESHELTKELIKTVKDALQIELRPTDPDNNDWDDDNFLKPLELGSVAHEPGTIPLKGFDRKRRFLLDKNLMLCGREGVYVCVPQVTRSQPDLNYGRSCPPAVKNYPSLHHTGQ